MNIHMIRQIAHSLGVDVAVTPAQHLGQPVFDWSIKGDDWAAGGMAERWGAAWAEIENILNDMIAADLAAVAQEYDEELAAPGPDDDGNFDDMPSRYNY